jgi:phosphohistidine phosphatase
VLCSTALRACETAELALAGFEAAPQILYEDALYLATSATLIRRLRRVDETCGAVMVIGHNPGLHELAIALAAPGSKAGEVIAEGKFPTGVRVSFDIGESWSGLSGARHKVADYVTVKSLGGRD